MKSKLIKTHLPNLVLATLLLCVSSFQTFAQPAKSLNFDGTNDYVTIAPFDFYTGHFTIEGWVKSTETGDKTGAIIGGFIGNLSGFDIQILNIDGMRFSYRNPPANAGGAFALTLTPVTGNWHHFAGVYDTDNKLKLYIDGVLEATSVGVVNTPLPSGALTEFNLGFNVPTSPRYYGGFMDDIRIWNYPRTQSEIIDQKDCELTGTESGLVAYYNFNQGVAGGNNAGETTLTDIAGSADNGTLQNFSLNGSTSNWVSETPMQTCNTDADGDGVNDEEDLCSDTPTGEGVNADGCSCSQVTVDDGNPCTLDECENGAVTHTPLPDADGDGVCDNEDNCVNTANADQADGDGDGIGNACDACPTIPDPACAACGNGKYLVCHLPAGNPANYQQLCLPYNGALAHIGNHGGCYWGLCTPQIVGNPNGGINSTSGVTPTDASKEIAPNYFDQDGNPLLKTAEFASYYFEVAPNPASDQVNIHLHGQEADTQLLIHDQFGRLLLTRAVYETESEFTVSLTDSRFVSGMYYVTIFTNGKNITQRLLIAT